MNADVHESTAYVALPRAAVFPEKDGVFGDTAEYALKLVSKIDSVCPWRRMVIIRINTCEITQTDGKGFIFFIG